MLLEERKERAGAAGRKRPERYETARGSLYTEEGGEGGKGVI